MILDKVISLERWKQLEILSSRTLTFVEMYCIKLKSHVKVFYQKIQVKFEFGFSLMIFDRVILLELRKNNELSESAITFVGIYV
jgi:hypothetical protein